MAIISQLEGVKVEIVVAGDAAQEYPNESQEGDSEEQKRCTTKCYVKSVTAEHFSIRLTVGPPYVKGTVLPVTKLEFQIKIDGKEACTEWAQRPFFKKNPAGTVWSSEVRGIKLGKGYKCTIKEFNFAKIATNDDTGDGDSKAVKDAAKRLQSAGTIEVKVYNAGCGKYGGDLKPIPKGFLQSDGTVVPEKALKGLLKSHGTA